MAQTKTLIEVPDFVTVRELAGIMGVSPIDVIKELMSNGIMANINQQIDFDTASIVAEEMGFEVVAPEAEIEEVDLEDQLAWRQVLAGEREADLEPRPPVVTMLGSCRSWKNFFAGCLPPNKCPVGRSRRYYATYWCLPGQ